MGIILGSNTYISKVKQSLSLDEQNIKLGQVFYYKKSNVLEINLLIPSNDSLATDKKFEKKLYEISRKIVSASVKLKINLRRAAFSPNLLFELIDSYLFSKLPLIQSLIDYNLINIENNRSHIDVIIKVSNIVYSFMLENDATSLFEANINMQIYENVNIKFVYDPHLDVNDLTKTNIYNYQKMGENKVDIVKRFNDMSVSCNPIAIRDLSRITSKFVTVCGEVCNFQDSISKNGNKYFSFILNDPSGQIKCLFFDRMNDEERLEIIESISDGISLVVDGNLSQDEFSGSIVLFVKSLAICKIDNSSFASLKLITEVPDEYMLIKPVEYEREVKQINFFEKDIIYDELKGEVVVFDLEATELDTKLAKIIEIAGVKMIDGVFHSSFETFVNPGIPIPADASNVNNIYDKDVKDAPKFQDIVADFYKFTHNATLVAHNIKYDINVLNNNAEPFNYKFNNKQICTLELARELIKGVRYNLENLAKKFKIEHVNAHRALSDAETTANLYKELIKIKNEKFND